jgi:glycosyltransferase involved in cell wall biosynthesis
MRLSAGSGRIFKEVVNKTAHIVIDARIRRASTGRPIDRLLEYLQDLDHDNRYTILLQPDDPWKPRAGNFTALPCPFPQFSLNPLNELRFAWQLYRLKPDLVHFTMTQQPLLYFGNIVTMTHDLTMLNFVRRGKTPLPAYWMKLALYRFLMKWSHRKSNRIIVPTKTTAKEVAGLQPSVKNKLVPIYEAAEPKLAKKSVQPKGVSGDFIMYAGTSFPHKNLRVLIKAFDILQKNRPNLKLVLAGKREINSYELEEWAKSRPSYKNIIFAGFIPDAELRWLYEHTQAYVFTSLSEGFGLPPLEAMANGAPVVSSNASVMPEVYGHAAHYCDVRDPEDVAQKVEEVLSDPTLRSKLIEQGHKQLKKYSWQKWAQQNLEVYRDALK